MGLLGAFIGGRTSDAKATPFQQGTIVAGVVRTGDDGEREREREWEQREKEDEDGEGGVLQQVLKLQAQVRDWDQTTVHG